MSLYIFDGAQSILLKLHAKSGPMHLLILFAAEDFADVPRYVLGVIERDMRLIIVLSALRSCIPSTYSQDSNINRSK
jgi:hypothetical protein